MLKPYSTVRFGLLIFVEIKAIILAHDFMFSFGEISGQNNNIIGESTSNRYPNPRIAQ
jgi:hypothetical protein